MDTNLVTPRRDRSDGSTTSERLDVGDEAIGDAALDRIGLCGVACSQNSAQTQVCGLRR